ncbi:MULTISPECIES: hypothetical protein [Asticcacaulis]|uniref:Uncharacterized protein n=1 Tax=Asticcacaulis excentricus (strain ATCC 15261 / DSM 4724 / KCTC 12464 / NCIMB 9791 / VKM B-1370 / CB 48) TaxID=573065 RepID=E8RSH3_ASTEC|nr:MULTISPECIES: hypothetical protein [Asticcacaulis]ADU14444.1 hypothetical protein Astex_2806 [Asticcacaulis excentricus CB 48]
MQGFQLQTWQTFLLVLVFLAVALGLRLWLAKAAWGYHPGGMKGYLQDLVLETVISYAPMLLIIFGVRIYIDVNPQYGQSPMVFASIAVAVVSMMVARRIPLVKAASARMMKARNDRWEAYKQ